MVCYEVRWMLHQMLAIRGRTLYDAIAAGVDFCEPGKEFMICGLHSLDFGLSFVMFDICL